MERLSSGPSRVLLSEFFSGDKTYGLLSFRDVVLKLFLAIVENV